MTNATITLTDAEQFFYDHAGYSHDPATETSEHGHARCAMDLAAAEQRIARGGYRIEWDQDYEFDPYCACEDDDCPAKTGPAYCAALFSADGIRVLASLCGITFERGHDYSDDPYARVVAAELALEAL
jgi:hypothetical protein